MTRAILPSFPGISIAVTRTPLWSTTSKKSVSGRGYRSANMSFPLYKLKLSYSVLRQTSGFTEFETLVGFFNARRGSFEAFVFTDPDDNTVTAQVIGAGNGSNTLFQLVRTFGGFVEPVFDFNSAPQIYVAGLLQTLGTHYSVSDTGLVTFVTAPTSGQSVTWTGTYYRTVHFAQDSAEFTKFLHNLWELKTLELETTKP